MRYNHQQEAGYMFDISRFVASASLFTPPQENTAKSNSYHNTSNLQVNNVTLGRVASLFYVTLGRVALATRSEGQTNQLIYLILGSSPRMTMRELILGSGCLTATDLRMTMKELILGSDQRITINPFLKGGCYE